VPATGWGGPRSAVTPNPCRSATQLRLQLARTEPLTVTIHDAAGRGVRTLVHGALLEAGETRIPWDGRDDAGGEVRSGVYFCHIRAPSGARTIPIILRR
jgi:flagellar hook assembly protein FlgD